MPDKPDQTSDVSPATPSDQPKADDQSSPQPPVTPPVTTDPPKDNESGQSKPETTPKDRPPSDQPSSTPEKTDSPDSSAIAWLKSNGAEQYVQAFGDLHYVDVEDLTPEVIKNVLTEKGAPQGLVERLVRIRTRQLAKSELLPPPELKPGMVLDMSAPELKGTENVSMKLPDLGFGAATAEQLPVISAAELTSAQWVALAKNSDMLTGVDLAAFYEGRSSMPEESFSPALDWVVPENDAFFNCKHLSARINTEITYSARQASMVAAGFTAVDAKVSTPFVSASVSVETSHTKGESSASSKLYIVATYDFERVRVDLEQCTQVSPKFVGAIEKALSDNDAKTALTRVFEKYGQVIGSQVTLGGRLYFVHVKDSSEVANMESEKVTVSASVAGAYGGFGGSVGVSSGHSTESKSASQNLHENISFQAIGGDVTMVNDPENWKNTIKLPALWEVIRYDKLRYTYTLLPEQLREKVLALWEGRDYLGQHAFPVLGLTLQLSDQSTAVSDKGEFAGIAEGKDGAVTAFGIGFDHKVSDLSVRYWGKFGNQSHESERCENGKLCASPQNGEALQEFAIILDGNSAQECALHYRARIAGKGMTEWKKGGELCGVAGESIDGIQVLLTPPQLGVIEFAARSFVPKESKNYCNDGSYGDGVIMCSGGEMVLTYKFNHGGTRPVRRRLDAEFASNDLSRYCTVECNGKTVTETAPDFLTGNWTPDRQRWGRMCTVELQPGENVLKILDSGASVHFRRFRLVPEVIDIPADSYNRSLSKGSLVLNPANFGAHVMYASGSELVEAHYDFLYSGNCSVELVLECEYAAQESRPVSVEVNGQRFDSVLAGNTGSWSVVTRRVDRIGKVQIRQGLNSLVVTSKSGKISCIREFRFVPEEPFLEQLLCL